MLTRPYLSLPQPPVLKQYQSTQSKTQILFFQRQLFVWQPYNLTPVLVTSVYIYVSAVSLSVHIMSLCSRTVQTTKCTFDNMANRKTRKVIITWFGYKRTQFLEGILLLQDAQKNFWIMKTAQPSPLDSDRHCFQITLSSYDTVTSHCWYACRCRLKNPLQKGRIILNWIQIPTVNNQKVRVL